MIDGRSTSSRVGVLYGGTSPERDISLRTGKAVLAALLGKGHDVEAIDVGPDLPRRLIDTRVGVAFVCLHGKLGEDGSVQGLLEVMRIPYTHSGVLASSVSMDKVATKRFYEHAELPTPAWTVVQARDDARAGSAFADVELPVGLPPPWVVKPANAGSTLGITVVQRADRTEYVAALQAAARYDQTILVERFVAGTEITVAVLGASDAARALPIVEIVPPSGLFDFDAKYEYTRGKTQYLCPARVPKAVASEAQALAIEAHRVLGCEGVTRSDLIVDGDGRPWLLETNTVPGMTETSLVPKAAAEAGIGFPELVEEILSTARLKL